MSGIQKSQVRVTRAAWPSQRPAWLLQHTANPAQENVAGRRCKPFRAPPPETIREQVHAIVASWCTKCDAASTSVHALSVAPYADHLFLLDVVGERFRFSHAGSLVANLYGNDLKGRFVDAVDAEMPALRAQCEATVAMRGPTYYQDKDRSCHFRILLPISQDGQIVRLLGAVLPV